MLIVVTVDTQQLPVAAVRRVVVVVVIFVMNRELSNSLARKFAPAPSTDPRKHLERSLPIGLLPTVPVVSSLGDDIPGPVGLCARFLR
jgi:hypothetical protein